MINNSLTKRAQSTVLLYVSFSMVCVTGSLVLIYQYFIAEMFALDIPCCLNCESVCILTLPVYILTLPVCQEVNYFTLFGYSDCIVYDSCKEGRGYCV